MPILPSHDSTIFLESGGSADSAISSDSMLLASVDSQFLGCLFLPIRIGVPKPRMQVHAPASCRNSQTEGQMHSFCSAILWKQATALPNGTLRYLISKHYCQTSPCALSWEITIRSLAANTYIRRPSGQKISKAIRARPITGA